jgi:hypothetical protein
MGNNKQITGGVEPKDQAKARECLFYTIKTFQNYLFVSEDSDTDGMAI